MKIKHFVAILFCAYAASGADEALPKAETVLDRYVEVTGGKSAHNKVKSAVMEGTMSIPAQNISVKVTSYLKEPNLKYQSSEFPGVGMFEEGSDGKVAWTKSAMMGARLKDGDEKAMALQSALNKDANWRDYFTKAETVGVETVDGKQCYKLELTPKVGRKETRYYDKSTGMIVKISSIYVTQMGEVPSEITIGEFTTVEGVKTPRTITTKVMGREMNMKFDSVKYNVEIPADRFKLPADVQALVDKSK